MCLHCKADVLKNKFDAVKAIKTAIEDYSRHISPDKTDSVAIMNSISDAFITRLAKDSWTAKTELREFFRRSSNWNENLQALVINGTLVHEPNYRLIEDCMIDIIAPLKGKDKGYEWYDLRQAIKFFTKPNSTNIELYLDKLNKIAPKAYHAGKKQSKIFKAMCDALGITDNTKGSKVQKLYAKIADEFSLKKVQFKLYVSINPAHFLSMSNPKNDMRGSTMVSCHSLNSTEYSYNCGCSGYARDKYTFIAFTVADDNKPETFNNRKTTRQIFVYKPNNGVLLQSRMYTTNSGGSYGGVNGDTEEGKLYRELIQREISSIESAQNLWQTEEYCGNSFNLEIKKGAGFGGYPDWEFEEFEARISLREDHKNNFASFEVGSYGLCLKCGKEIDAGLYCVKCLAESRCQRCRNICDTLHEVIGLHGERRAVCTDCFRNYYSQCAHCGEYHHVENITEVESGNYVCERCLSEHYTQCECCGKYFPNAEIQEMVDINGDEISACEYCSNRHDFERHSECEYCGRRVRYRELRRVSDGDLVCRDCLEENYTQCEDCGEYVLSGDMIKAADSYGNTIYICESCAENYEICYDCNRLVHRNNLNYLESGVDVCNNCLNEYYGRCEICDELHSLDDVHLAIDAEGNEIEICETCAEYEGYEICIACGRYVHPDAVTKIEEEDGVIIRCPNCAENQEGACQYEAI